MEGAQSCCGQPHDLISTYLNLETKKDWILSVLYGDKNEAFWKFRENPNKKWWQRTDSVLSKG